MSVALLFVKDDRAAYTLQTLRSFLDRCEFSFKDVIVCDDVVNRAGGAGQVRIGWDAVYRTDAKYVFHLENDWTFPRLVDIPEMVKILDRNPQLANLVLRRQPWGGEGANGYITDEFVQCDGFLQHRKGFWLNPCLYPTEIVTHYKWPEHGHEHHFSQQLIDDGWSFGVLGSRTDPPRCHHIGVKRTPSWSW